MYHYISTMFNGTEQKRCGKSVVHNHNRVVTMCNLRNLVHIRHGSIRIAESLNDDSLCVGAESLFNSLEIGRINNGTADALGGKRMLDEVKGAAIEIVGSDDMVTILCHILQGISDSCSTRGYCQTSHATLKGSHTVLENTLCGIGQTTVDVTCIAEAETVSGMLRIMEYVRRCLVDGYST